jgi:hypothetical protein
MVEDMQLVRKRLSISRRLLSHLCLLGLPLAIFILATSSRPDPPPASYETTVSAFKVPQNRVPTPMGNAAIRRRVNAMFAGIPQHRTLLGDPAAPVTMQVLADPECPEAREFALRLLPVLVRRWVRDGRLRIEYLDEKAETIWPYTFRIQKFAVLAAGGQNRLWQYLQLFYEYQGQEYTRYADRHFFLRLAEEVPGLDIDRWTKEQRTGVWLHTAAVHEMKVAQLRGITLTPAFLIGPTGGRMKQLLDFTLTEPLAFEAAFEEAMTA